jgi:threonine dehydrogenase-like Zn-dependent dehydrogenase
MRALEIYRSTPRYVAARAAGGRMPGLLVGAMAPVRLVTRDRPAPPGGGWAAARPLLSGICGSDLGVVTGSTSLYFSALSSMPFVPGHEVVAELLEDCGDLPRGSRVVVDPVLPCAARGLAEDGDPCASCTAGTPNLCDRVTVGHLSPGLQTGFCRDTGGGWGEQLSVHRSQLHPVPDDLPDERAVLVEPLACAVHLAHRAEVAPGDAVLVSGAGAVGLFAVLALRELTAAGSITVVAKHERQVALARAFGATDVVRPSAALGGVRRSTRAMKVSPAGPGASTGGVPELLARTGAGRSAGSGEFLLGGVDVAVDCVGSTGSLDLALRATRAGGRVVLSGMPAPGADLSPVWFRELTLAGTYASRGDAFDVALRLAATAPLEGLVGGRYPLHRWREALDHAHSAGRLGTVKVCFDARDRS